MQWVDNKTEEPEYEPLDLVRWRLVLVFSIGLLAVNFVSVIVNWCKQ